MRSASPYCSEIALLLTSAFVSATTLPTRWSRTELARRSDTSTIPAAINVGPSQYWDGDDGPWSSFPLQIGNHAQVVRAFVSTALGSVLAIAPGGCPSAYGTDCTSERGGTYNSNDSLTYVANSIYDIGIEKSLGLDTDADAGFDTVTLGWQGSNGPTVDHTILFDLITPEYWVGLFGVNPRPTNFTNFADPTPSFIQNLVTNGSIPSLSYGYTAGNQYRLDKVFGSLVLGGYDQHRFAATDVTFPFNEDVSIDLSVNLKSIFTNASTTSLLPDGQISVFLDSSVAGLYLPESACAAFEDAFGLSYDSTSNFYLINDSLHTTLANTNPSVTFTIGPDVDGGDTVNITLPYGAFDLQVTFPNVENPNTSYYFPLQKAANSTQYVFGRTFFQEAYLIVDYGRQNFTVAPCTWDQSEIANASIVSVLTANETRSEQGDDSDLSTGAIAGIAVGVVVAIIAALCGILLWLRHKKRERKRIAELEAKAAAGEGKDDPDADLPVMSHRGELDCDDAIHQLDAPYKPAAQEMDSPYKMDPNQAGYAEMEAGGEYFDSSKGPRGAAEMHGSMPIFEMPGSDVQEMPASHPRPVTESDDAATR